MSAWKEGDLVEAKCGDTVIRARLKAEGEYLMLGATDLILAGLTQVGWDAKVIERAPEPLPTEPGYYSDKDGGVWKFSDLGYLAIQVKGASGWFTADHLHKFAPFSRLRPEAEVAAEVLDKIRAVAVGDGGYYDHQFTARQLREIGAEFGVTS